MGYVVILVGLGITGWACHSLLCENVGSNAKRCFQLVGGSVGFGRIGSSVPAENVAFASLRTGLDIDMVSHSCAPATVRPPNRRGDMGDGHSLLNGDCYISDRYPLKSDIEISRKDAKPQRIEKKLERICALISVSFTNWVNSFTLTISKKS